MKEKSIDLELQQLAAQLLEKNLNKIIAQEQKRMANYMVNFVHQAGTKSLAKHYDNPNFDEMEFKKEVLGIDGTTSRLKENNNSLLSKVVQSTREIYHFTNNLKQLSNSVKEFVESNKGLGKNEIKDLLTQDFLAQNPTEKQLSVGVIEKTVDAYHEYPSQTKGYFESMEKNIKDFIMDNHEMGEAMIKNILKEDAKARGLDDLEIRAANFFINDCVEGNYSSIKKEAQMKRLSAMPVKPDHPQNNKRTNDKKLNKNKRNNKPRRP